jgi:hypothetical protein
MKNIVVVVTLCQVLLLMALVRLFGVIDALASLTGPTDDIGMLALLVPFILWHALLVARHGRRAYRRSALILLGVLGALLMRRYFDTRAREGWWYASRSIHIFAWSSLWFCFAGFWVHWRGQQPRTRRRFGWLPLPGQYEY